MCANGFERTLHGMPLNRYNMSVCTLVYTHVNNSNLSSMKYNSICLSSCSNKSIPVIRTWFGRIILFIYSFKNEICAIWNHRWLIGIRANDGVEMFPKKMGGEGRTLPTQVMWCIEGRGGACLVHPYNAHCHLNQQLNMHNGRLVDDWIDGKPLHNK